MCIRDSFTRAWIEIPCGRFWSRQHPVALFTRAWIEMIKLDTPLMFKKVALFTRAWIEIETFADDKLFVPSPSSRGRGLKSSSQKGMKTG